MGRIRAAVMAAGLAGVGWAPAGAGPAPVPGVRVDTVGGWVLICQGEGPARRCTAARRTPFTDSQGREHVVTLSLLREGGCTTLSGVFDTPIDLKRPVWLTVDGGPRLEFAVPPPAPRPHEAAGRATDLQRFITSAAGRPSAVAAVPAGPAPAGLVKEPWRVAVTCAAMGELMPRLATAATLRLEFSPAGFGPRVQPYHWPALARRAVDVPLSDVLARLTPPAHVP